MRLAPILLICALAACAPFPQIGTVTNPDAPYPDLVPLGPLLAQADAPGQITPASVADLSARVAGLQARAARLRGPVIDPGTRARMRAGIAQPPLR